MRNCMKTVPSALLIALLFVQAASTQPGIMIAKVSVPFDFWIGAKNFPAGDYTLDSAVPTFVSIRSTDGKVNEQIPTLLYADPVKKDDARLVFSRRNGKYFLSELWGVLGKRTMTADFGRILPKYDLRREVRLTYP
jgi:hypothetical protein